MEHQRQRRSVTIRVGDDARLVEFLTPDPDWPDWRQTRVDLPHDLFVGRLGQGRARYPVVPDLIRHRRLDERIARTWLGNPDLLTDNEGERWCFQRSVYIRNRIGRICGWADTTPPTNLQCQTRA